MKVLHLIDDEKFTDFIISENNKISIIGNDTVQHQYLAYGKSIKFTKKKINDLILVSSFFEYKKIIQKKKYDVLIIHCLTLYKALAIKGLNLNSLSLVWCMWGIDFYNTDFYRGKLYLSLTNEILSQDRCVKIKNIFRTYYHKIKFGNHFNASYKYILDNVHFFAPIVFEEIPLINTLLNNKVEYLDYSYANINSIVGNMDFLNIELRDNIFIGNSATPESNHLDVFDILKKLNINNRVIVPLNYGQVEIYGKKIYESGSYIFGEKFEGILEFLPLELYVSKIKSCGICIMGHVRQQALGNILLFLLLGSKVFLSKRNPIYESLIKRGYIIFSLEDDLRNDNALKLLDIDSRLINRDLIIKEYSPKSIEEKYIKFYNKILNKK